MEKEIIIEVNNLKRVYTDKNKDKIAVNNVSFNVEKGQILALIGPNGAGKTTIIKILTTILAPTSGTAKVFGYDCFGEENKIRKRINFVYGGESGLYWRLTGYENLEYFSYLYQIPKNVIEEKLPSLLKLVKLDEAKDLEVEKYSKGMRQRLLIARSLINNPDILFMDEPTIGLDPIGVKELRNIIFKLKQQGKTIVLTTHNMSDVEILSDQIIIIKKGEVIKNEKTKHLMKEIERNGINNLETLYIDLIGEEDV